MQTWVDSADLPDERDDYRYSLLIETYDGPIVAWRADDFDDINAMGDAFDNLIRERTHGEGMPMSIIDHFAHLKDEN